ncbi:hypothetical protein A2797_00685 [candidate division WWE3 bacterium RIFCSPHIGHO2_01_FULL_48_15]|uniref:Uncharacterized protein n=1 Tax=candidate division WWE3 bacterium RIFCSPHIGHO2_01_FULL_48_15 TaxID=1802619 RepID=A0A1F4VCU1_UNCKA|nr:MAG: hypothetical protein A2797_00685 [candidate division WWE3 bacterium RIFCSPHIGHO2_01_FULL_48_15]
MTEIPVDISWLKTETAPPPKEVEDKPREVFPNAPEGTAEHDANRIHSRLEDTLAKIAQALPTAEQLWPTRSQGRIKDAKNLFSKHIAALQQLVERFGDGNLTLDEPIIKKHTGAKAYQTAFLSRGKSFRGDIFIRTERLEGGPTGRGQRISFTVAPEARWREAGKKSTVRVDCRNRGITYDVQLSPHDLFGQLDLREAGQSKTHHFRSYIKRSETAIEARERYKRVLELFDKKAEEQVVLFKEAPNIPT